MKQTEEIVNCGNAFLARRLRYGNNVGRLRQELERYTTCVRELNARLLG